MRNQNINMFRLQTTAYSEEDFFIITTLSEEDVEHIVAPIVQAERDGYQEYDNEMLLDAIEKRHPGSIIKYYSDVKEITTIII